MDNHRPVCKLSYSHESGGQGLSDGARTGAYLQKDFNSRRLEQVRDVFIFSCFTGLSYVDVKNLTKENVCISFDGKQWLRLHRQKTSTAVNLPLLKTPLAILKKYEDKLSDGRLLPVLSNQKLNSYLKEIADICGIKKNLTFHCLRHITFSYLLKTKDLQRLSA